MFFYRYSLKYYEDADQCAKHEIGIVVGSSSKDALDRLAQMYGHDFWELEFDYLGDDCEDCLYDVEVLKNFIKWREERLGK